MGLDTLVKRGFRGVIAALVLLIAYFQGRGLSALVGGELPTVSAPPTKRVTAFQGDLGGRQIAATPILARNPFDSVTGPLDRPKPTELPPPPPPVSSDPNDAPPCQTGSVVLIAGAEDPAWSFAVIRGSGSGARMRRIGDDVDGQTVHAIGWDRVLMSTGTGTCKLTIDLGKSTPKTASRDGGREEKDVEKAAAVAPDMSGDIRKVSETEYVVKKSARERVLNFQAELMKGARVVAGKGIRLARQAKAGPLGQLGMTTGDVIKNINGFDMTNPDKAVEAYSKLKTAMSVTVDLDRKGEPITIRITVE